MSKRCLAQPGLIRRRTGGTTGARGRCHAAQSARSREAAQPRLPWRRRSATGLASDQTGARPHDRTAWRRERPYPR
jgi:hypothetical protein